MLSTKGRKFPIKWVSYKSEELIECVFPIEAKGADIERNRRRTDNFIKISNAVPWRQMWPGDSYLWTQRPFRN